MRKRHSPTLAASCLIALACAMPLQAQSPPSCSEQLASIEPEVANMHVATLQAQAERLMTKARAYAGKNQERRCQTKVNTIQKLLKKDRMEQSKPDHSGAHGE